ncbi:hypothetical protein SAMN04488040_1516 [Sulfitobacter marinus]|uniref:Uncharacterized protein n=1 Tax=Sulfitobacter marinus TaxID=394264 RepID=A0A1I6RUL9_9RHOB|nr:hypothetical protein [Sulfitobacter marinus]SFS68336.1 hypothetical protein SAMN04488040_1516 [Sulfitobacter marinus]
MFWLGGAVAAIIAALVFKLCVCAAQKIRDRYKGSPAMRGKTGCTSRKTQLR